MRTLVSNRAETTVQQMLDYQMQAAIAMTSDSWTQHLNCCSLRDDGRKQPHPFVLDSTIRKRNDQQAAHKMD